MWFLKGTQITFHFGGNMYTQNISTKTIETRIVGVSYENRQSVVAQLQQGEQVLLIRQPENSYDENAVMVTRQNGQQFGYLNRELAAMLATRLDRYGKPLMAYVSSLVGGYSAYSSLGVTIRFQLPE
jgi:single-stranded-DNA-specific exonuclease